MVRRIKSKILLLHKTAKIYTIYISCFIISVLIMYIVINYHITYTTINNITLVGDIKKDKIGNLLNDFQYDLLSFTLDSDIVSMNKERIDNKVSFIKYYKRFYKDIIIINDDKNLVTGYLDNTKEYLYRDYVVEALNGKSTMSQPISVEGEWYVDLVGPIIHKDKRLGIIAVRISLLELSNYLKNYQQNKNMEIYLVNSDGYFLTGGKNNLRKIGEDSIDINEVKHSIDYNPRKVYKNYDNNNVYGKYYDFSMGNWTLIIEFTQNKNILRLVLLVGSLIVFLILFLMNKIVSIVYKHEECNM